jgi:hypothetical protein
LEEGRVKKTVREGCAKTAKKESACYSPPVPCYGDTKIHEEISRKIGYSEEDLKSVPEAANLGLGCGNPIALASLKEGETVLDLGSGATMKDKYIELIREAVQNIKILEETHFPIEYMINDPTAKSIMKNLNISVEKAKEVANSVANIKVYGVKPPRGTRSS